MPGSRGLYTCPDGLVCGNPQQYKIPLEEDGVYGEPLI